jgi:hypothetical protein
VGEGYGRAPGRWLAVLAGLVVSCALSSPLASAASTPSHATPLSSPRKAILPPHNPRKSIPPRPNFYDGTCGYGRANDSKSCVRAVLSAIAHARKSSERLGAMKFRLNAFLKLSPTEQLFVTANLERTARGLPPVAGLTVQLDSFAHEAAVVGEDPSLPLLPYKLTGGGWAYSWGANWAGGTFNALGSDYGWVYDDGPNSPNFDCHHAGDPGCWGHRDNILATPSDGWSDTANCSGAPPHLVMGAASATSRTGWKPSQTQLFVLDCGAAPRMFFTWRHAKRLLHLSG